MNKNVIINNLIMQNKHTIRTENYNCYYCYFALYFKLVILFSTLYNKKKKKKKHK